MLCALQAFSPTENPNTFVSGIFSWQNGRQNEKYDGGANLFHAGSVMDFRDGIEGESSLSILYWKSVPMCWKLKVRLSIF